MSSSDSTTSGTTDKSNVTLFLVPLTAVIVVGLLALWLQRRRQEAKQAGRRMQRTPSFPSRIGVSEYDVEASWVRGPSTGGGRPAPRRAEPPGTRTIRSSRRWAAWSSRLPEGLNELGEAPPPYDPRGRESLAKDEVVEMRTVSRAGGSSTDGGSRPDPGAEPSVGGLPSLSPPCYEQARGSEAISRPPPAFVPQAASHTVPRYTSD